MTLRERIARHFRDAYEREYQIAPWEQLTQMERESFFTEADAVLAPFVAGYAVVGAVRGALNVVGALALIARDGLSFGAPVVRR